jgi:hypothetical protein
MGYDLKAMDSQIVAIEEGARKLKELAHGFEAVERNAEAILAFVYILRKNVSDVID